MPITPEQARAAADEALTKIGEGIVVIQYGAGGMSCAAKQTGTILEELAGWATLHAYLSMRSNAIFETAAQETGLSVETIRGSFLAIAARIAKKQGLPDGVVLRLDIKEPG